MNPEPFRLPEPRQPQVDLLVVATFTPAMSFPSTACLGQDRLKLNCPAFDLQAACAGFVAFTADFPGASRP